MLPTRESACPVIPASCVRVNPSPRATATAPPLIIMWGKASDGSGPNALIFGGSTASVAGAAGSNSLTSDLTGVGGDTGITGGGSSDLGGTGSLGGDLGTSGPAATPRPSAGGGQALGATTPIASHGEPIKAGAIILAVIGAGLLAFGMRRLSDDVLTEQVGTSCPLDEV